MVRHLHVGDTCNDQTLHIKSNTSTALEGSPGMSLSFPNYTRNKREESLLNFNRPVSISYCATDIKTTNKRTGCIKNDVSQIKVSYITNTNYLTYYMNFK